MRHFNVVCMVFALMALSATAVAGLRYEVWEIPDPPTGSAPIGSMAEGSISFAGYNGDAWWYRGGWTKLSDSGSPKSASSTGYVVGRDIATEQAVGWHVTSGGVTYRQLNVPTQGPYPWSEGYGVNNRGIMVGAAQSGVGTSAAYIHDWNAGSTTFIDPMDLDNDGEPADIMNAIAVNDAGIVVGNVIDGWYRDGFVHTPGSGVASLGVKVYAKDLEVWDLSENGYVAGAIDDSTVYVKKIGESGYTDTGLAYNSERGGVNDAGWVASGNQLYHDGTVSNISDLVVPGTGYGWFGIRDINSRGVMIGMARESMYSGDWARVLLFPVAGDNVVPNPEFDTTDGLVTSGEVEVVTDPDDAGNNCLQMTTASPVYIEQLVDTPNGSFEISFDYRFLDAGGTLLLELNGQELEVLGPASKPDATWVNHGHGYLVNDPSLYNLSDAALRITFDHDEADKRVLLDSLHLGVVDEIPEPTILSLMGLGGLAMLRRRRGK